MPPKNLLCICGTDTDIGKTVVTAALLRSLHENGLPAAACKAVQTGCVPDGTGGLAAPDVERYREACPQALTSALLLLQDACSPHLAARLAGEHPRADDLTERITKSAAASRAPLTLVEGAGGLLTPLNQDETLLDVFRLLDAALLLVVGNKLGAVNHALLTAEALGARGLSVAGFILTTPVRPANAETRMILADNREIIQTRTGLFCLAELGYIEELHCAAPEGRERGWKKTADAMAPLARRIAQELSFKGAAAVSEKNWAQPGNESSGRANAALPRESGSGKAGENSPAEGLSGERTFFFRGGMSACNEKGSLLRFDREHLWHPYTSATHPLTTHEAVSTRGTRIRLRDGGSLVDGMASWWCAIHGYNHPVLMRALLRQTEIMPHVMFGGLTHEPAVNLARKLLCLAPGGLEHVFFADSGSVAVEAAIKMAVQYQHAAGRTEKSRILTVRGGYHGDTMGAMSVCDPVNGMHSLFSGILPVQYFAPRPDCPFDAPFDPSCIKEIAALLEEKADSTAAVILEPVLQGAGGMYMYHPEYLRRVSALCREHYCLLILDEIATGFGRTGALFASEWAGIAPDIMCVGKALTGGVLSLAAVLASAEVAEGISRKGGVLMHGPTFMSNPLACAVAGASLSLLDDGSWRNNVARIQNLLREGLEPCRDMPGVADVRVLGAVGVLEMRRPVNTEALQHYFITKHGVWLRPFARLIYVMPPYIIDDAEVDMLTSAMRDAVRERIWE